MSRNRPRVYEYYHVSSEIKGENTCTDNLANYLDRRIVLEGQNLFLASQSQKLIQEMSI